MKMLPRVGLKDMCPWNSQSSKDAGIAAGVDIAMRDASRQLAFFISGQASPDPAGLASSAEILEMKL